MSTSVPPAAQADPVAAEQVLETASTGVDPRRHLWIVRRLLLAVVTLFIVSLIVFAATQILPGDAAQQILGRTASPDRVEQLRQELGLDRSPVAQYLDWIGGVVQLDFGDSLAAREPVTELIGGRLVNTLLLVAIAFAITIPLSLLIGAWAAVRRDKPVDHAVSTVSLVLNAIPDFVVGMVLVLLLATSVLTVLPAVSLIPQGESAFAHLDAFILPVATLVIVDVPYLARLVRASMIDTLESEYVQLARLKGLPERHVLFRHALPNALVPTIQGAAVVLAYMAGGIVVVEYLFQFSGIGSALVSAVQARDLPVVQATTLILAAFYVLANLVADVLTVLLTPRLRTAGR